MNSKRNISLLLHSFLNFFSKCDESHSLTKDLLTLTEKFLTENLIFVVVYSLFFRLKEVPRKMLVSVHRVDL